MDILTVLVVRIQSFSQVMHKLLIYRKAQKQFRRHLRNKKERGPAASSQKQQRLSSRRLLAPLVIDIVYLDHDFLLLIVQNCLGHVHLSTWQHGIVGYRRHRILFVARRPRPEDC